MKNLNKYLILLICLFACIKSIQAQKIVNFSFDDFEKVVELTGEKLNLHESLLNPVGIIFADSLLFIRNSSTNIAVDVISLTSGKTISRFGKRGRGPGEIIGPFYLQYIEDKSKFIIQDAVGQKLVYYDLDLILKDVEKKYSECISFEEYIRVHRIVELKDGNLFCNLVGNKNGYMNCLLSKDGELIKFLDKYPKIKLPFNPEEGVNIFGPRIGVSPSLDKVIMPFDYSGLISVYNYTGDKIIEFRGPDYKELDLVFKNGRTMLTNRNVITYNFPCSNSNSFMVPYNGTKNKYAHSPAYHIFHFGFDGSLLQHFKTDQSVTNIAVDWENRIIYGINKDLEPCIYKFKF